MNKAAYAAINAYRCCAIGMAAGDALPRSFQDVRGTMALSKTTQDHDEIKEWAEKRGAKPAEVASTEEKGGPGIVRLMFPKAPHHNDNALKEISWDDFFKKFDEAGLALVYQEVTKEGAESNFNKLIHPDDEDHPAKKK